VTLRPTSFNLWVAPILCLAIAGVFLWGGYQMVVQQGLGDAAAGVAAIALAVMSLIAVAVLAPKAYIRADDSAIIFGPKFLARNRYVRREVARMRMSHSPLTRITLFLRSDGSVLCSTAGAFWGRDGLQRLADYLGVPFEG